jgi:peptide chain release factor 1
MFDRLEVLLVKFEDIMNELNEPSVTGDQNRFRNLMKEQSDLTPIVEAYKAYRQAKQDIEDSLSMLDVENDPEMREMLKEALSDAKNQVEELENQIKDFITSKGSK